jgi:hypothetical protein
LSPGAGRKASRGEFSHGQRDALSLRAAAWFIWRLSTNVWAAESMAILNLLVESTYCPLQAEY